MSRLELHAVYTVPLWDDRGALRVFNPWRRLPRRVARRLARCCVGWGNLAEVSVGEERHLLWLNDAAFEPDDAEQELEPDYDDLDEDLTGA